MQNYIKNDKIFGVIKKEMESDMKEEWSFEIVKLFKVLLFIIFVKEIRVGYFKGFWNTLKKVFKEYRVIILFYLLAVLLIMKFIDEPVVNFWQTKYFQKLYFYYPGIIGNLLGNGEYLYSFLIVVILVSKLFKKEELRKKYSLALTTSVFVGIVNSGIKFIFLRDRPPVYDIPNSFSFNTYTLNLKENLNILKSDYSMPSGHTSVATAAFFTLAILEKNRFLKVIYAILPFITAYARVYFTKHWTSDVSLSILLGTLFAVTVYRVHGKRV